jgi:hypothetical protein
MMRIKKSVTDVRGSTLAGGERVRRFQLALASTPCAPAMDQHEIPVFAGRCGSEEQPHRSNRGDLVLNPMDWE